MDMRSARREYRRPELVSLGRVEVETRGPGGIHLEVEMEKSIAF